MQFLIVQSFLAAKVSDYFSKEWKAKVSIGGLEIRPLLTVGLKDVYLENPQKDTIATVGYLEASLKNFEFIKGLEFSYVRLDDVNYDLTIENHKLNLSFIIDYFKSRNVKMILSSDSHSCESLLYKFEDFSDLI